MPFLTFPNQRWKYVTICILGLLARLLYFENIKIPFSASLAFFSSNICNFRCSFFFSLRAKIFSGNTILRPSYLFWKGNKRLFFKLNVSIFTTFFKRSCSRQYFYHFFNKKYENCITIRHILSFYWSLYPTILLVLLISAFLRFKLMTR